MAELPGGTVTLLFTDIEGSTRMLQELGHERYVRALSDHRRLLREAFCAHGGVEVEMQGDSFHFAFGQPEQAVGAAAAAQRALAAHDWQDEPISVRIGLHTGTPLAHEGLYAGLDVHRAARVMATGYGGQVLLSETTGALVEDALPETLSLRDLGRYRLKDLSRPQQLYQLVIEGLPQEFPPLRTLEARPTNLPVQPTRLIGRERELAEISERLRSRRTRLLTLTGAGGSGKTRLALEAAAHLVDDFENGVFFVSLAPLRDPALVLPSIAQVLGVVEQSGKSVEETLVEALEGTKTLLLLDNFEHLLEGAVSLAKLLETLPELVVVATSREPLHLAAEQAYQLAPLATPERGQALTRGEAWALESVQLFVERAQAARAEFELTDENAEAVGALCAGLDGLPLAIELAAARSLSLSPRALLERLDQRLELLTRGPRDAGDRQRTLKATIAWSHELLSAEEKRLFARLSVFADGCRADAAAVVCAPEDDGGLALLDGLSSLVEKSLMRQRDDPDGEPRFWMFETIRDYAAGCLRAAGEDEGCRGRHAQHLLTFFEEVGPTLAVDARWLPLAESEQDNARAAFGWLLGHDPVGALRLAIAMSDLWYQRGRLQEGRRSLEDALAIAGEAPLSLRVRALGEASDLVLAQGDAEGALPYAEAAVALARKTGEPSLLAQALHDLGEVASHRGERGRARELYEQAYAEHLAAGNDGASTLANLGDLALVEGDFEQAASYSEQALALHRAAGRGYQTIVALQNIGAAKLGMGAPEEALPLFREALERSEQLGFLYGIGTSLDGLAGVAAGLGEAERAARLLGAADALLESIQSPRYTAEQRAYEGLCADLTRELGAEMFRAAREDGRNLSPDEAILETREVGRGSSLAMARRSRPSATGVVPHRPPS